MPELYERNNKKANLLQSKKVDQSIPEKTQDKKEKSSPESNHQSTRNSQHHSHHKETPKPCYNGLVLLDKRKMPYELKVDQLSDLSRLLKKEQISAFWNAFMLFDHYETCTINSTELAKTLGHLGIPVRIEDIQLIIDSYDDNQNGELDFEEYLNLMTNPDVFARILNKGRQSMHQNGNHGEGGSHDHQQTKQGKKDRGSQSARTSKKAIKNSNKDKNSTNSKKSSGTGKNTSRPVTTSNAVSNSSPSQMKIHRPTTFHTPNKPDYRDCIMYEVMNEFFNSKSLSEEQEEQIVGFYAKTMKTIHQDKKYTPHAAHVVHHYADGARSLGLTEKEIEHQIEAIKEQQRIETNEVKKHSPYAKPMAMIPAIPKNDKYRKKYKVMAANNEKEACAIWRDKPIVNYKVQLPSITVKEEKCAENLQVIRNKTAKVKNLYRVHLSEVQKQNSEKIWASLRFKKIPNQRLQDIVEEVFSAYTTNVRMQPLQDKPNYIAYSVDDFENVFQDDSDSEGSGVYDFLEPYQHAPFIQKRKERERKKSGRV